MRYETKLIKKIINEYFPKIKCKYLFKKASNYRETSDKIIIAITNGNENIQNEVIKIIKNNTNYITVYKYNNLVSNSGKNTPCIKNIDTNEYIQVDCLEFIEVRLL